MDCTAFRENLESLFKVMAEHYIIGNPLREQQRAEANGLLDQIEDNCRGTRFYKLMTLSRRRLAADCLVDFDMFHMMHGMFRAVFDTDTCDAITLHYDLDLAMELWGPYMDELSEMIMSRPRLVCYRRWDPRIVDQRISNVLAKTRILMQIFTDDGVCPGGDKSFMLRLWESMDAQLSGIQTRDEQEISIIQLIRVWKMMQALVCATATDPSEATKAKLSSVLGNLQDYNTIHPPV